MKNIAVFTSGGDSPGMNATVRAVARAGIKNGINVYGIYRGYEGLMQGDLKLLGSRDLSGILQKGGTVLKTARSKEFITEQGRAKAVAVLNKNKIDALIGIGGDGTFKGLLALSEEWNGQILGLPGTIDNDIYGTDYTIGYDTAINTAMGAIDKIKDTAESHERYFIVEVMGRDAGFIAIDTGISCGAEGILIPEIKTDINKISEKIKQSKKAGKTSCLLVTAEGDDAGNAIEISEKMKQIDGNDYKVSILGYMQRGGSPTARDRILASKLGAYAVLMFLKGKSGVMIGEVKGELVCTCLKESVGNKKKVDNYLLELVELLN